MLDFYAVGDLLTPEERQIRASVRRFLDAEALPDIGRWWEEGSFPAHLVPRLAEMGLFGSTLPGVHDGVAISNVAYGLVMYELERIDSGLRSFVSVQSSLVMYPIHRYGSDEQRARYLPGLASGETVGCFSLTEPEGGSDVAAMATRARRDGDSYVLNGTKMWISNGGIADVALVWAKDDDGDVRGFLVPTDADGFTANPVERKMSLRASVTSELVLDGVRVSADRMLPGARGLGAPLSCLTQARYGIAWGALGALEAVYTEAVEFSRSRRTFGKPIASRQLVQAKLAQMLADHTSGLLRAWRLGKLKDEGAVDHTQVSLAKRENVRAALVGARAARDILGASGITLDHHTIRHMLNLETVDTYEGTYDVHTLVLGRHITGENAFQ